MASRDDNEATRVGCLVGADEGLVLVSLSVFGVVERRLGGCTTVPPAALTSSSETPGSSPPSGLGHPVGGCTEESAGEHMTKRFDTFRAVVARKNAVPPPPANIDPRATRTPSWTRSIWYVVESMYNANGAMANDIVCRTLVSSRPCRHCSKRNSRSTASVYEVSARGHRFSRGVV